MNETRPMPSAGTYLALTIIGFFLGILWGILCLSPYKKMKAAIEVGNADEAWKNAGTIRTLFIIGLVINVVLIIGQSAMR